MSRTIFTVITAAAIFSIGTYKLTLETKTTPIEVIQAFKKWSTEHNKIYKTPTEFIFRLGIFYKNFLEVKKINSRNGLWQADLNQFMDITKAEMKAKYFGYKFTEQPKTYRPREIPERYKQTPNLKIDWRDHGAVSPIGDQGACGSCWAFSAVAAMEGEWAIKNGTLYPLSTQELVDCSRPEGNYGCQGGYMTNSFKYAIKNGMDSEANYPYKGTDLKKCRRQGRPSVAEFTSFFNVGQTEKDLENAVRGGVVSVAFDAYDLQLYSRGIYDNKDCGTDLNLGGAVVGFGAAAGRQFWIVKNAWGPRWGENGYIRMLKNSGYKHGICGILQLGSYPVV